MRLSEAFDPKANSLNLIRVLLAVGVIVAHGFDIPGAPLVIPDPSVGRAIEQLLEDVFVDGFFALSGFLIVASWERWPKLLPFLTARALRLFPAFWVVLVVTAFAIAPATVAASSGALPPDFWGEAWTYVLTGLGLVVTQPDIAGTPLPSGDWNLSLWTLFWEVRCYVLLAALGLFGLLRGRNMLIVFGIGLALGGVAVASDDLLLQTMSRFILMFSAGALVYLFRARIIANWWAVGAALVVTAAAMFLPDYRLVGAIPLAYALIITGALLRRPALRTDLSYGLYLYASPIQAGIALLGVTFPLANMTLGLLLALPFAAASWFLVERPALRMKRPAGELLERWNQATSNGARRGPQGEEATGKIATRV